MASDLEDDVEDTRPTKRVKAAGKLALQKNVNWKRKAEAKKNKPKKPKARKTRSIREALDADLENLFDDRIDQQAEDEVNCNDFFNLQTVVNHGHSTAFETTIDSPEASEIVDDDDDDDDDADCAIFEEEGVGLEDEDQCLNEEERADRRIPPRFKINSDPRLGPESGRFIDDAEFDARCEHFRKVAHDILRFLKATATEFFNIPWSQAQLRWRPTCKGVLTLLRNASEDFLLDHLLSGIEDDVQSVLGMPNFTIRDLLALPRWSMERNTEKGVYLDVLNRPRGQDRVWNLYVGSGAGKFGVAQRWYDYLEGKCKSDSTSHSKLAATDGTAINLRGLAHYGEDPFPWLPCLSETFFMLYLGTIVDPGARYEPPDFRAVLIHDDLYKIVEQCRKSVGLDAPLAYGLNYTWSIKQGYRKNPYGPNTKCGNCGRAWVPKNHPTFTAKLFSSMDQSRPGETIRCRPCRVYRRSYNGKERPSRNEMFHHFRRTVPIPAMCSNCDRRLFSHEERAKFGEEGGKRADWPANTTPARIFQDDRAFNGKCFWVCYFCQCNKMGVVYQLDGKAVYDLKRKKKA
jgi:hypothetical protein